jgi:hypothetical protein
MSFTFASKFNQNITTITNGGYCISVVGNSNSTNQIVKEVSIEIGDQNYVVDLVVLPGVGIDVILGMK